jgi:hypothetical protein
MPVILTDSEAKRWINSGTELSRITAMLKHYYSKLMNAYPINPRIKNPEENDKQLIQPTGSRLLIEEKYIPHGVPKGIGYHQARKAYQATDNTTMAGRINPIQPKSLNHYVFYEVYKDFKCFNQHAT